MTVTFLIDNIKMGRTGITYPFVLEVPEFGQIAGRVTETQRGATQVAFPSGVKAIGDTAGRILCEFQKQVAGRVAPQYTIPQYAIGTGGQGCVTETGEGGKGYVTEWRKNENICI